MCNKRDGFDVLPINLIENCVCLCLSMFAFEILTHPINEVIFEDAFDDLMEEIWGYQFINICVGKMFCKRLAGQVKRRRHGMK